jgi:hypothetical protein
MSDQENIRLVFEGSSTEADLVANILEDSGILTFIKNKRMGQLFPHYATHGGIHPVKIFVKSSEFEHASDLINAYFKTKDQQS